MTISSRTPEGDPNMCPICGHRVRTEPSIDTRDAPCPSCGHLLWFAVPAAEQKESHKDFRELAIKFAAYRFGRPAAKVREAIAKLPAEKFFKMPWEEAIKAKSWKEFVALMSSVKG